MSDVLRRCRKTWRRLGVPSAAMMLAVPLGATSWWFAEMVGASPDSAWRRSSGGYGTVLEPPL